MAERSTVPAASGTGPASGERAAERDPGRTLTHRPDPLSVTTAAEFAAALTTLREQSGITIRDLARAVGVTSNTVGGYFSGRHLPSPSATGTVEKILAACGVPPGAPRQTWLDALHRVRRLPGPRPAGAPVPYRGLESYRADDATFFFGREKLVARLVALVTSTAGTGPTVVVGPSGSGKSSALQAGLAARLRSAGNWEVTTFSPGAHPSAALDAAIASIRALTLPPGARVAVIVDQFEELFTLCADDAERQAFVRRLAAPLHPGPGLGPVVTVVIALRADFYAAALGYEALSVALQDRQVVVGPMSAADLRRAVTEPARAAGVQIDPGLTELVLHDMAPAAPHPPAADDPAADDPAADDPAADNPAADDNAADRPADDDPADDRTRPSRTPGSPGDADEPGHEPGALPLLSYALLETWRRGRRGRLTVEDYVAAGGVCGAVANAAEKVYAELTPAQRELARQLFLRLVAVSEQAGDTRRRVRDAELGLDTPEGEALSEVLERFVAARLLTTTRHEVEIAHEAVLTAWPRLRTWVDADRAGLVTRRRIRDAAVTWQRAARDAGSPLRGSALSSAREWSAVPEHAQALDPVERDFLAASVAAHDDEEADARQRHRRTQRLLAAVSVVALLSATISGLALVQRASASRFADRALSRELAEAAGRLRRTDPSAAAQFAVLAWHTAQTAEARAALLDTSALPLARRIDGPGGQAATAVSGDGRVLAAVGEQGGLRVWQLDRQRDPAATELIRHDHVDDQRLDAVALDRTGSFVTAAGASGVLHAWDLRSPRRPVRLPDVTVGAAVRGLALAPDGHTLAVSAGDGRVRLYDVASRPGGTVLTSLGAPLAGPAEGQPTQAVAFSADSRQLAVGGGGGRVAVWSLADREQPRTTSAQFTGGSNTITSLAFSADGRRLAAGSKDQRVYVWQPANPSASPQRLDDAGGWVNAVAYSPDGALLAVGGSDRHLRVYDTATRALVADLPHPGAVTSAGYLPDGRALVTGSADGVVRLWPSPSPAAVMPVTRTVGLAYLADGRLAATTSKNTLRVFDVRQPYRPRPLGAAVGAPAVPASGTAGSGGSGTGAAPGLAGTMAADRSGSVLAAGGTGGWVWLFAPATRGGAPTHPLATLPHTQTRLIESATISPDGRTLVTGSDDSTLQVTDISTPTAPRSIGDPLRYSGVPYSLAVSPSGDLLAVGTGHPNTVTLWSLRDREHPVRVGSPVTGPSLQVYAVAFSPDGRTLAVGSADRSVRLLDVASPARPRWLGDPLLGAGDDVTSVTFSPDGDTLAAASGDGVVRLWDVGDREHPTVLAGLTAAGDQTLYTVTFDRDTDRLAAAGVATSVLQWDLDPRTAADRVCRLAGAPLGREEWSRYLPGVDYAVPCRD